MTKKFLIVAHLYYASQKDLIIRCLDSLSSADFSLLITCDCANRDSKSAAHEIEKKFPTLGVIYCENKGMDVLPFLEALAYAGEQIHQFSYICKFHSKNRSRQKGIDISNIFLKYLFDTQLHEKIITGKYDFASPLSLTRLGKKMIYGNITKLVNIVQGFQAIFNYDLDQEREIKNYILSQNWIFSCGTMFLISQRIALDFQKLYNSASSFFERESYIALTGDDGSYAHAFERYFGLHIHLAKGKHGVMHYSTATTLGVTEIIASGNEMELSAGSDYFLVKERTDQIKQLFALSEEPSTYKLPCEQMHSKGLGNYRMNEILKYYFYGDIYSTKHQSFEPGLFIFKNKKAFQIKQSAYLAYLLQHNSGINIKNLFEKNLFDACWEVAEQVNFIDKKYILNQTLPQLGLKEDLLKQYFRDIGGLSMEPLGSQFDPNSIPILKADFVHSKKITPLTSYITQYYILQIFTAESVIRDSENGYFYGFCKSLERYQSLFGMSQLVAQSYGFINLMLGNIDQAIHFYRLTYKYKRNSAWESLIPKSFLTMNILSLCSNGENVRKKIQSQYSKNFIAAGTNGEALTVNINKLSSPKVCIYTSIYGDRDVLLPVLDHIKNIDFICFTDQKFECKYGWKSIICNREYLSDNLNAKRFKIFPYKYLEEYDYSLFVDANTLLYGNLLQLLDFLVSLNRDLVFIRHPERANALIEAAAIDFHRSISPLEYLTHLKSLSQNEIDTLLDPSCLMPEASFIFRNHKSNFVKEFMEQWWAHIISTSSFRDQPSLFELINLKYQNSKNIALIQSLSSRDNHYFLKLPHIDEINSKHKSQNCSSLKPNNSPINKPTKLVFLFDKKQQFSGSTVMRCFQLADILKENNLFANFLIYTSPYNDEGLNHLSRGDFVILSKGVLAHISLNNLQRFKEAGLRIIADYIDMKVNHKQLRFIDMCMCASISQYLYFKRRNIASYYVTHHVDPRIKQSTDLASMNDLKSFSYIGEKLNLRLPNALENMINVSTVDTSSQNNIEWISAFSTKSMHYMIRNSREIDGFKPFLKGFSAAVSGSFIFTLHDDADISFYLGDYPFALNKNSSDEDIVESAKKISRGITLKEHQSASDCIQSIRERVDYANVSWQFINMLDF